LYSTWIYNVSDVVQERAVWPAQLVYEKEIDPKGWSTVLVTALGSWGTPEPRAAISYLYTEIEQSDGRRGQAIAYNGY
jgi:hypothetical protein